MEKPQTAEPPVCATKLFVLVLCFHRHSRFVSSILQSISWGVETLASPPPPSGVRPVACGRQLVSNSSTTICPSAYLPLLLHSSTSRLHLEAETTGWNYGRKQKRTFWHSVPDRPWAPCPTLRGDSSTYYHMRQVPTKSTTRWHLGWRRLPLVGVWRCPGGRRWSWALRFGGVQTSPLTGLTRPPDKNSPFGRSQTSQFGVCASQRPRSDPGGICRTLQNPSWNSAGLGTGPLGARPAG